MSTQSNSNHHSETNVWFGVAMVLIGIIVGYVFAMASGRGFGTNVQQMPSAPSAPTNVPAEVGESAAAKMTRIAAEIGLDPDDFKACVDSGKFRQTVLDQQGGGSNAGVDGTPGNILYNMKTKTAWLISGARPIATFQTALNDMIKDPNGKPSDPSITVVTNVVPVDIAKDHVRGNTKSDIALIEYSDYECPFCQRVHPTLQQLMSDNTDKLMWVHRQFPLPPNMHPNAQLFAEGSECIAQAGGNEAFWKFTDKMYE